VTSAEMRSRKNRKMESKIVEKTRRSTTRSTVQKVPSNQIKHQIYRHYLLTVQFKKENLFEGTAKKINDNGDVASQPFFSSEGDGVDRVLEQLRSGLNDILKESSDPVELKVISSEDNHSLAIKQNNLPSGQVTCTPEQTTNYKIKDENALSTPLVGVSQSIEHLHANEEQLNNTQIPNKNIDSISSVENKLKYNEKLENQKTIEHYFEELRREFELSGKSLSAEFQMSFSRLESSLAANSSKDRSSFIDSEMLRINSWRDSLVNSLKIIEDSQNKHKKLQQIILQNIDSLRSESVTRERSHEATFIELFEKIETSVAYANAKYDFELINNKIDMIHSRLDSKVDLKDVDQIFGLRHEIERFVESRFIEKISKLIIPAIHLLNEHVRGTDEHTLVALVIDLDKRCKQAGLIPLENLFG
jgi:hypothetical protein